MFGSTEILNRLASIVFFFSLLLGYLFLFSANIFSVVPEQFGGGRPKKVQLILFQESLPEAAALGLNIEGNGLRSAPVYLLWEGEDSYLISSTDAPVKETAKMGKQLVAGLITLEEPKPPRGALLKELLDKYLPKR